MPSDSVASFLDAARDSRLLPPDRLAELARDPDVPTQSLPALAADLESRGLLTRYQAGLVGGGRGRDLFFAGYPVTDVLGPCPGGTAYHALHPVLRTQAVLRRYRPDWFAPSDTAEDFARRAQEACPISHPHLAHLLDAGVANGEPYAACEPVPGAPLDRLVQDIGPMPGFLAAEFGRQVADALAAAHAKGVVHGDVQPAYLTVGPLVPTGRTRRDGTAILRPAQDGTATLLELGLVPRRPPTAEWVKAANVQLAEVAFTAPERVTDATPTPAGDVFSLGATLFYALTARFPFRGVTADELVADMVTSGPRLLAELRPDLPAELAAVIQSLVSRTPSARPTAAEAASRLASFAVTPTGPPPAAVPSTSTSTSDILGGAGRAAEMVPLKPADEAELVPAPADHLPEAAAPPSDEWAVTTYTGPDQSGGPIFAPPAAAAESVPRRRPAVSTAAEKQRQKMWIYAGAGLWLLSIPLWIILLNMNGCFSSGGGEKNSPDAPRKGYRK